MKVPFPANNHHHQTPKTSVAAVPPTRSSPYEPKSVLELRGSPSPVADHKPDPILSVDPLQLEDHVLIGPQLDDWDSLMRDLGLHDDPNPNPNPNAVSKPFPQLSSQSDSHHHLPEFPPVNSFDSTQFVAADFGLLSDIPPYANPNAAFDGDLNSGGWDVAGFDYVDELIRLAECFETNSLQLGHVILARLNQRLRSPSGKPLQRAAFYFKEALQSLLTGSTRPVHQPATSSEIIQTIKAQKTFSSISPIPMFSSFTAN